MEQELNTALFSRIETVEILRNLTCFGKMIFICIKLREILATVSTVSIDGERTRSNIRHTRQMVLQKRSIPRYIKKFKLQCAC